MNKKIKIFVSFIFILGGALYLAVLSWKRWLDCQVDFGAQLYVPWQLAKGKVLYKDIFYYYGPLADYFHAFLFKHFGVSLLIIIVVNFFILFITAAVIYSLFQYLNESYGGFISLVIFLGIFAFGRYVVNGNYNYICPYSHDLVYGLTLSLIAIFLIRFWLNSPRIIYLASIGFLTGLILLTKFEIVVAFLPSFLVAFCLKNLTERSSFLVVSKRTSVYLLTCTICPAVYFLCMLRYLTPHDAIEAFLYPYSLVFKVSALDSHFYEFLAGLDYPYKNLTLASECILAYLAIVLITGILAYGIGFLKNQKKAVILLGLLILFAAIHNVPPWTIFFCLRGLPFVLIVFLLIKLYQFTKNSHSKIDTKKDILLITLTIFSILLVLKVFLNLKVYHYGFALAMPGTLLLGYIFTNQIACLGKGRLYQPEVFRKIAIFLIIGVAILHIRWTKFAYDRINNPIAAGNDGFYGEDINLSYRGQLVNDIVKWLDQNTSSEDTLLVVPEGVMINYLARRDDPIPMYEFAPSTVTLLGEDKIINMLNLKKPTYIIFLGRDMSEHGAKTFGKDYATNIYQWIIENYQNILIFGELPSKDNNNTFIPQAYLLKMTDRSK